MPWILPALIVSVGLLYYCIGYTGYISTLDWDGAAPNPERSGWPTTRGCCAIRCSGGPSPHLVFFVVTFVVEVALGLVFACILHSKLYLGTCTRC